MASDMPLPVPPRTPTPPPDDTGGTTPAHSSPTKLGFNLDALSPISTRFPAERYGTLNGPASSTSQKGTPSTIFSPASSGFPYTPTSPASGLSDNDASLSGSDVQSPFNFQSVQYLPGKAPMLVKPVRSPRAVPAVC